MSAYLAVAGIAVASLLSLFFSSLTYSLREYSRSRLADFLGRHNGDRWFESITENTADLIFLTAILRQFSNILIWVMVFACFEFWGSGNPMRWALMILVVAIIAVFCSVAVPHAAAKYAASEIVGAFAPVLSVLRIICVPFTQLMHVVDDSMRRVLGAGIEKPEGQIEEDILSAVDEGEKEGVVNEQEREMIESVIEFRDTAAAHVMTPKGDIVAVPVSSTLEQFKAIFEKSGHSRYPVYEESLDHVIGVLYARDLIQFLSVADARLDVRAVMRPAIMAPETQPLRELFSELRHHNIQIAIILDEYGSTSGIVTVEDIMEELVGEITDEHEPAGREMLRKLDDRTAEADARVRVADLNQAMGLTIPEDAGFESLGGFLMTYFLRIPEKGAVLEQDSVRYTVIDAEPQRIKRVKIELLAQSAVRHAG